MNEYKVRVKDRKQGITHKATQIAQSQRAANKLFLHYLQKAMGHKHFEVL